MDSFFDPMVRAINRNLLKYSAGTAIFCPHCDEIADARRWVVVSHPDRTCGLCASCWDVKSLRAVLPPAAEVIDGRVWFARPARAKKAA